MNATCLSLRNWPAVGSKEADVPKDEAEILSTVRRRVADINPLRDEPARKKPVCSGISHDSRMPTAVGFRLSHALTQPHNRGLASWFGNFGERCNNVSHSKMVGRISLLLLCLSILAEADHDVHRRPPPTRKRRLLRTSPVPALLGGYIGPSTAIYIPQESRRSIRKHIGNVENKHYESPLVYQGPHEDSPKYDGPIKETILHKQDYGPPKQEYGPPPTKYEPPAEKYGPPKEEYGSPPTEYEPPAEKYGPPKEEYGPQSTEYEPPVEKYGPPSTKYELPVERYGTPEKEYPHPKEEYGPHPTKYEPSIQ
ncbi:unnamed protein product [Cyprideis torosa]|uniref:Uncharacterized protein n=1 Tax=Cyprideis torosa TaxID=163714 RepID=A0A7R8WUV8_9CRUS|nr:unnamed protein product [Cyprideis torosa]CAG0906033.1 unnamed protein product [Cyprideis torosa]